VSIEVGVKGLSCGFEDHVAIGANVKVVGNNGGNAGGEASFQVFAYQSDSLSTRHRRPPGETPPPPNTEHGMLQLCRCTRPAR